jgi:hypothetical protein
MNYNELSPFLYHRCRILKIHENSCTFFERNCIVPLQTERWILMEHNPGIGQRLFVEKFALFPKPK